MIDKRIIFFHPYSIYGGADLSISKLIDSVPKDYLIEFITFSKNPKIKFYTKRKFKLHKLNCNRAVYSILPLRKIIKNDILKYKKNIILSNQNFANIITIISCIFLSKIRIILFERNHISELDLKKSFIKNIKNSFIKILIKYLYKFSDLILGNSKELCEDLKKLCKCKIQLLYNFYDFKKMHLDSIKKLEKKINFKDNIILNVGRLEEQKNQLYLLKVFKYMLKKNNKLRLLIIGNGKYLGKLRNFINKNNLNKYVQILTKIKNSLPYYKRSSLYVSTSIYEGFPNVILEAIAMNIPVISKKYKSGLREILLNGNGGTIINNESPESFANKIIHTLENRQQMYKKVKEAKDNIKKFRYDIGKKKFQKFLNFV